MSEMTRTEYLAYLRTKELPSNIDHAEAFIVSPHGRILIQADNWKAIADVLERCDFRGSGEAA